MGVFDEIKAAFAEAGQTMAEVTGVAGDADGNTLHLGRYYTGVYGPPQVDRQMLPAGGYRQRTALQWTVPRAQFDDDPKVNTTLTRIDLAEHLTYRIDRVNFHDPVHYVLTLIRVGE